MFRFIKKIIHFFVPPLEWRLAVALVCGVLAGVSIYIYYVSNAAAYLSDDPVTCINCHVMIPQYTTWRKSSHAHVATCMDCHVPHDSFFRKYEFKIKDGMRHATIFTLRAEPQVIRIKKDGMMVVQENCIRCHKAILEDVAIHKVTYEGWKKGEGKLCWECHRDVPHGTVNSLSSTPYARSPEIKGGTPQWLKGFLPSVDKYFQSKQEEL